MLIFVVAEAEVLLTLWEVAAGAAIQGTAAVGRTVRHGVS